MGRNLELLFMKAISAAKKGDIPEARRMYETVLRAFPKNPRALKGLSALPPSPPETRNGADSLPQAEVRGLIDLYNRGQLTALIERCGTLAVRYPRSIVVFNALGAACTGLRRFAQAEAAFGRAIAIDPDFAEAHNNLGNALKDQGKLDAAVAAFGRAIALAPDFAEAHYNLANTLKEQRKSEEAVASYARAVALKPDYDIALGQKLRLQAQMCDWSAFEEFAKVADRLGISGGGVSPFAMLAFDDDPARNRIRSENCARDYYKPDRVRTFARPAAMPAKLRIGYFSADFHDHATLYLMAGLFPKHDRKRFEIHAYSYGANRTGALREQLARDVDSFNDVWGRQDRDIIDLAHRNGLDIAVDLKGYTQNNRSGLFAGGLAPVQISYLGYAGTMGAPFIGYIIADRTVIPPEDRVHYSEKVIYLPHSYFVTDDQRAISDTAMTRRQLGLPETGFVFCCFNNSYKITPAEFDIWMRLLQRVDGSALWLLRTNETAQANLRKEARARGVDPDRLVFAEWMPQAEHLARHRLADLFLDTFNYNAHTTASDALWAGLPVVTRLGAGFASRVGGSLLSAIGLPELIARDSGDYERLALALATDADRLAAIRARLAQNRLTEPLFDTERFTRHLEAAYEAAYGRYFSGQGADHMTIEQADSR